MAIVIRIVIGYGSFRQLLGMGMRDNEASSELSGKVERQENHVPILQLGQATMLG